MALPATDTFTTGSDAALQTYSANWAIIQGGFFVSATYDTVSPGGDLVESGAYWSADSFDADQYAQLVFTAGTGTKYIGPAVRGAGSGATACYYGYYGNGTDSYVLRVKNGTWRQGGAALAAWTTGHTYRIEVATSGDTITITVKDNGSTVATRTDKITSGQSTDFNATDVGGLTSGSAGLSAWGQDYDMRADSWEGGNLNAVSDLTKSVSDGPTISETGTTAVMGLNATPTADTITWSQTEPTPYRVEAGQYAYPISDVAKGNWTDQAAGTTNIYASIDEAISPVDTDYIRSGAAPSNDTYVAGLTALDTPDAGTVTLRVRARWAS